MFQFSELSRLIQLFFLKKNLLFAGALQVQFQQLLTLFKKCNFLVLLDSITTNTQWWWHNSITNYFVYFIFFLVNHRRRQGPRLNSARSLSWYWNLHRQHPQQLGEPIKTADNLRSAKTHSQLQLQQQQQCRRQCSASLYRWAHITTITTTHTEFTTTTTPCRHPHRSPTTGQSSRRTPFSVISAQQTEPQHRHRLQSQLEFAPILISHCLLSSNWTTAQHLNNCSRW